MFSIQVGLALLAVFIIYLATNLKSSGFSPRVILAYTAFLYGTFLKPHSRSKDQQAVLESQYKDQANTYDATRAGILPGRLHLLSLLAVQLKERVCQGRMRQRPIWVEIGGGTGYAIEAMSEFLDVPNFFESVYLVDLTPSLLEIARKRFARLGWANVRIICQDAGKFRLQDHKPSQSLESPVADLITMTYSLSMIPDFFPVIDTLCKLLSPSGLIGVVDFYVENTNDIAGRNYTAGLYKRHHGYWFRSFWRSWFDMDRISLDPSRRGYLEYKLGSILNINCWKYHPRVIPYYIWIGCPKKQASLENEMKRLNAIATGLATVDIANGLRNEEKSHETAVRCKAYEAALANLEADLPLPCFFYQNRHWRLYYEERMENFARLKEIASPFTWEDTQKDGTLLQIDPSDVILALTNGGDNILAYALEGPVQIHAVDNNPIQNHVLELKIASYAANLELSELASLFTTDNAAYFSQTLISKLSGHLSSRALQFWLHHAGMTDPPQNRTAKGKQGPPQIASLHSALLAPDAYHRLSNPDTFKGLSIHTDELGEVLTRLTPGSLTIAIIMNCLDTFPTESSEAYQHVSALSRLLRVGGRILLHSTSATPWYIKAFEESGFRSKPSSRIDTAFASTWICTKVGSSHS